MRRSKLFFSLLFLAALYSFLIGAALFPSLPSPQNSILFYSNQQRDDFRLVLRRAFEKAKTAIHVTMYAITDEELLQQLHRKAMQGLDVRLWHDRRSGSSAIPPPVISTAVKAKGLMHRKIVVVDHAQIFLGSANMTTSSLVLHDNLTLGLYHPSLARFLNAPTATHVDFTIGQQPGRLWLLPDSSVLEELLTAITQARTSIFVAMFTLTHPQLLEALAKAHRQGVQVTVALDHYAARGASRKAVQYLQAQNVPLIFSQGLQLLHHKWAYIDRTSLIMGSTNWTKAAFTKNQDCLVFLHALTPKQQKLFDRLCDTIRLESIDSL